MCREESHNAGGHMGKFYYVSVYLCVEAGGKSAVLPCNLAVPWPSPRGCLGWSSGHKALGTDVFSAWTFTENWLLV